MSASNQWTRPFRWASITSGQNEGALRHYLRNVTVAVRVEPGFGGIDVFTTLVLAVNMLLRFCPHLAIATDSRNSRLLTAARALSGAILGSESSVTAIEPQADLSRFDAVLTIGCEQIAGARGVVINSNGWVARLSTVAADLPWRPSRPNAIGALAAACLGVGAVAMLLLKLRMPTHALEISLLDHELGGLGDLGLGPDLPLVALDLGATVFGCGGVMNGWAYTVRRLPIRGAIEAIDKQSLRGENLGPYVLSARNLVGLPKAEIVRRALAPRIRVTPRAEPLEFYKIRIENGLVALPPLVVAGLDDIEPRHAVQRLWPNALIDMGAGGTTSQLVVHKAGGHGACLFEVLMPPIGTPNFAERMAAQTGLSAERIRNNPTDPITEADVSSAPAVHQPALEAARLRGRLICGRITDHNLYEEGYADDFAPAVPFVSAFAGIVGAAETMKTLMGIASPLHHQFDFRTMKGRVLRLKADSGCVCNGKGSG
jgi:hypothetical protein